MTAVNNMLTGKLAEINFVPQVERLSLVIASHLQQRAGLPFKLSCCVKQCCLQQEKLCPISLSFVVLQVCHKPVVAHHEEKRGAVFEIQVKTGCILTLALCVKV